MATFKPSMFSSVTHFQCDLHLHRTAHKKKAPTESATGTLLGKAHTSRGDAFEPTVEATLPPADCIRADPQACFVSGFLRKLPGSWPDGKEVVYVLQAAILPSPLAVEALGLTGVAALSRSIMDILRITRRGGSFEVTIIDMKATSHIKTSHELQVGAYGLIIQAMLHDMPPGVVSLAPNGEIWLPAPPPSTYTIVPFSLAAAMRHVRTFLQRDFTRVVTLGEEECRWELRPSCETCAYFSVCSNAVLPNIEDCHVATTRRQPITTTALPMPSVRLVPVAIVVEPRTNDLMMFAVGGGAERVGTTLAEFMDALLEVVTSSHGQQIVTFSDADVAEILRVVFRGLSLDLEKYNPLVVLFHGNNLYLSFPSGLPKTVQILTKKALGRKSSQSRERSEGREGSMGREESLGREDDAPTNEVATSQRCSPVASVAAAVRHLYPSLSKTIHTFQDCVRGVLGETVSAAPLYDNTIAAQSAGPCRERCERLLRMGHAMYALFPPETFPQHPADYIPVMTEHPKDPTVRVMVAREQNELLAQLRKARVARVLLEDPITVTYTPLGTQPDPTWHDVVSIFSIQSGDVSVDDDIATTTPFTALMRCSKCDAERTLSRRGDKRVVVMCLCGAKPWEHILPSGRMYAKWFLVEASQSPLVASALVDDATFGLTTFQSKLIIPQALKDKVQLVDVIGNINGTLRLVVHTWYNLVPLATYHLFPRTVDFAYHKITTLLTGLEPSTSLFCRLLQDSNNAARTSGQGSRGVAPHVDSLRVSQQTGLARFWHEGFQVLWGPPGTGKTHYMATCIATLLRHNIERNKPCRIIVTSFTKAAIKNLMKSVSAMTASLDCVRLIMCHEPCEGTTHATDKSSVSKALCETDWAVVGATVHFLHRVVAECRVNIFQGLFVDEATQMPATHLAIPISLLDATNWCLMVGGDFMQLPPIVHGGPYYAGGPTEPNVYSSAMHALLQSDRRLSLSLDSSQALLQLQSETWPSLAILTETSRCNEAITSLTRNLYGQWYTALSDDRVVLAPGVGYIAPGDATAPSLLTLHYPSPANFQDVAGVVREFVLEVKGRQTIELSFAVITPLRVMRDACNANLAGISNVDIDTVEKMQGQERDVVIIVLAVPRSHDARIASFILDLCRINVAITRAKRMCVMVLSNNVISPPLAVTADRNSLACRDHVVRFFESSYRMLIA